ncbi:hypothetical protein CCYA_CCYA11G3003 [Cyanidiococcus yangmingshanensis]|nr:hypothetical protein CCYA_CCYA11G3003 [Cyanidiococcus yangmingshanensis]
MLRLSVSQVHELWCSQARTSSTASNVSAEPQRFLRSIQLPEWTTIPWLAWRRHRWVLTRNSGQQIDPIIGVLVRIRGMVQHLGEEEFCAWSSGGDHTVPRLCGFAPELGASLQVDETEHQSIFEEPRNWIARHALFLVPVPGDSFGSLDTAWSVAPPGDGAPIAGSAGGGASGRDPVQNANEAAPVHHARSRDGNGSAELDPMGIAPTENADSPAIPVLVYAYSDDRERFVLNEVVDAVGFLEMREATSLVNGLGSEQDELDSTARSGSDCQLVVHALRVDPDQVSPLEEDHASEGTPQLLSPLQLEDVLNAYTCVHTFLKQYVLCNGDDLAASYMLLGLLGSRGPHPCARVVVQLSLPSDTAADMAKAFGSRLYRGLALLTPYCQRLAISVAEMNRSEWAPHQRSGEDRLEQTALQLPRDTVVLLDESFLEASGGQLSQTGMRNLQTLSEVIQSQTIRYQYAYTNGLLFEINWPIILLTLGRGLLPQAMPHATDVLVRVPVSISAQNIASGEGRRDALPFPSPSTSESVAARRALERLRRHRWPVLPQTVAAFIEDDFVRLRREARNRQAQAPDRADIPDAASLDTMLRLASLEARARSEFEISTSRWQQVQQLEQERRARLCGLPSGAPSNRSGAGSGTESNAPGMTRSTSKATS